MNVNKVLTKDYEQMDTWSIGKTKPIQSQSKPIKANIMPKQSQYKPKQTQFYNRFYLQRPATSAKKLPAENQLPDGSGFSMLLPRLCHAVDKKEFFGENIK